jgi:hypothetical protein
MESVLPLPAEWSADIFYRYLGEMGSDVLGDPTHQTASWQRGNIVNAARACRPPPALGHADKEERERWQLF